MSVIRADSRWRALGAASVAVAVSLAAGSSAAAAGPACGDTISASTTLRSDLRDCPGDGLVIGADDITLDLNGRTIDGDAVSGGDDVGVRVDSHQGVVIRHGTVQEFDHAVRLTGSSHNQVVHLVATRNGDAIGRAILVDSGSDGNLIAGNDASGNGRSGIAVLDSSENLVVFNRTVRNGVAGMGIFGGGENRVLATSSPTTPTMGSSGATAQRVGASRATGSRATSATASRLRMMKARRCCTIGWSATATTSRFSGIAILCVATSRSAVPGVRIRLADSA